MIFFGLDHPEDNIGLRCVKSTSESSPALTVYSLHVTVSIATEKKRRFSMKSSLTDHAITEM